MAGDSSSSSHRRRWSGRPPLITCPYCKCRQVVELKSKQPWSCDEVFYTCSSHRQDGTGCPFWHWEAGYIKYLEQHPEAVKEAVKEVVSDEHFGTGLMEEAQAGRDVSQLLDKLRTFVALGYEITWLLKCLAVMGIFSVGVLGMLLAVAMTKNI